MQKFNRYIIALIIFIIPLYPKFPLLGVSGTFVSVRLEDIVLAILAIYWLLQKDFFFTKMHRSILVYLVIGAFAMFSGVFLTKTTTLNLGLLHLFRRVEYMMTFFIAFSLFRPKVDLKFIIRSFLLASLIVALYGLGQQFLGLPVISTTNSEFSKGLALTLGPGARINSTFAGHYDLAAYSVIPLLLIISLLTLPGRQRFVLLAIGALVYWSLLLSASRITFASFFLSAGLLILFVKRRVWLIPLFIIAGISVILSPQLRGRYFNLIVHVQAAEESKDVNAVPDALKPSAVPEDRSFSIRLNAEWPRAYRAFLKNPIFGTGFSSVGLAVDNDYLRSLAETGILGLSAFFLIFIRFFKTTIKTLTHYQPTLESAFIVAINMSLVSLLINSIFIDVFEASKIAIIIWTIVGLSEKTKIAYEK